MCKYFWEIVYLILLKFFSIVVFYLLENVYRGFSIIVRVKLIILLVMILFNTKKCLYYFI